MSTVKGALTLPVLVDIDAHGVVAAMVGGVGATRMGKVGATRVAGVGATRVGGVGATRVAGVGATPVSGLGATRVAGADATRVAGVGATLVSEVGATVVDGVDATLKGGQAATLVGGTGAEPALILSITDGRVERCLSPTSRRAKIFNISLADAHIQIFYSQTKFVKTSQLLLVHITVLKNHQFLKMYRQ